MCTNKNILRLVWPLIISGFGQSIVYVTDILFLGRLGEVALGASAIAGLFYASVMMIGSGISSGLQVLIAQKTGEKKYPETHIYLLNGIFLQGIIAILLSSLYLVFHTLLLSVFVQNPEIQSATKTILNIRILGTFPYFLLYAYRAYYLGIGQTKIISLITIFMSILNIALNPLLIYGWEGFINPLKYAGSAWASVISETVSTGIIMLYYSLQKKSSQFFSSTYLTVYLTVWKNILQTSLPLIFQHFISVFSWFLFFVFIEKMGTTNLAVSNIIRAVYILIMTPILAFSHITVTIIGQLYGAKNFSSIAPSLWRIIQLSILFIIPFSILAFFQPYWLMSIFTNNMYLMHIGKPVMQIISFALLYFALSMPILSAVTGLGDTHKALWIECMAFIIYTGMTLLGIAVLKLSLPLVWCNEFVYFTCIAFLSYYFFNKKLKKLISGQPIKV